MSLLLLGDVEVALNDGTYPALSEIFVESYDLLTDDTFGVSVAKVVAECMNLLQISISPIARG